MAEVILDGEILKFDGARPATWGELRAWLESTLAARGRVLAMLVVDGTAFADELGDSPLPLAATIEAASLSLAEALGQTSAALAPEFVRLQSEVDALANTVVRVPWSEAQDRCVQLVEATAHAMQRAVDVAALAGEGSAAATAVAALAEAVEGWMTGLQKRDAAAVCLVLDGSVGLALGRMAAVLRENPPR